MTRMATNIKPPEARLRTTIYSTSSRYILPRRAPSHIIPATSPAMGIKHEKMISNVLSSPQLHENAEAQWVKDAASRPRTVSSVKKEAAIGTCWSPLGDGIIEISPDACLHLCSCPKAIEYYDGCINNALYGRRVGRRRLPVFEQLCPCE